MKRLLLACVAMTLVAPDVSAADAPLPLPRFASVKSDEANMRRGPGTRYPIRWVYRKSYMPIEIIDEYHNWRKVRDVDGEEGWMHKSLLVGRRTAFIKGNTQNLYRKPQNTAAVAARLESKVMVFIEQCQPEWCKVRVSDRKGWMYKDHMWGVYDNEVFGE